MKGASGFSYTDRVRISLDAGCDMVLICNNREGAIEAIKYMENNNISTWLNRINDAKEKIIMERIRGE